MNMKLFQKTVGSIGLRAHQITQHIRYALIASQDIRLWRTSYMLGTLGDILLGGLKGRNKDFEI